MLNLDLSNIAPSWGVGVAGVRRLLAAGWSVDAHSLTHADLAALGASSLAREVRGSRHEIERLFGVRPRFFCYPAGRYDAEAVDAVEAAGYEGATTTRRGLAVLGERYTLARNSCQPGRRSRRSRAAVDLVRVALEPLLTAVRSPCPSHFEVGRSVDALTCPQCIAFPLRVSSGTPPADRLRARSRSVWNP